MMKPLLPLTFVLLLLLQWSGLNGQTLTLKETNLCLIPKNSKTAQCLNLKKSPIAVEYINGAFRMFKVPGTPVGEPPKDIFKSKKNTLFSVQSTISLKGNYFFILNSKQQRIFEMPFIPGTRGVFQLDRDGIIAFYTEDCLELEPIEVRDGQLLYDGAQGATSLYMTLVDRDDIPARLICKEGIGISCIEDNIIDPRMYETRLNLDGAFGSPYPADFTPGGMDLPDGGPRYAPSSNDDPFCKDCEELTETEWSQICEVDLRKKGLYKDCDGHLLVIDLETGTVCLDVDLGGTALRVESVQGDIVQLSLPASTITGEQGCCAEQ